ncbi:MAG: hypothetical protein ACK5GJ_09870 [Planctomycetota bacterium]
MVGQFMHDAVDWKIIEKNPFCKVKTQKSSVKVNEFVPRDVVAAPQYRAAANTAMGWKNANLRSEMTRLLRRAGVSGWPRLFHSMRASRQTELQREFPLHVVCSWLGNSPRIAQQSYLLVTEDDFAKAAGAKTVMV